MEGLTPFDINAILLALSKKGKIKLVLVFDLNVKESNFNRLLDGLAISLQITLIALAP